MPLWETKTRAMLSVAEYQLRQHQQQEQRDLATRLADILATRTSRLQFHADQALFTYFNHHIRSQTEEQMLDIPASQIQSLLSLLTSSGSTNSHSDTTRTALIDAIELHVRQRDVAQSGYFESLVRGLSTWDITTRERVCRQLSTQPIDSAITTHTGRLHSEFSAHTDLEQQPAHLNMSNEKVAYTGGYAYSNRYHPRYTLGESSIEIESPVAVATQRSLPLEGQSLISDALSLNPGTSILVCDSIDLHNPVERDKVRGGDLHAPVQRDVLQWGGTASRPQSPVDRLPTQVSAPKNRDVSRRAAPYTAPIAAYSTKNPSEYDVLFGHRKIVFSHPGNAYLKRLVTSHRVAYDNASARNTKTLITKGILQHIRNEKHGRFLKYVASRKVWSEVPDEDAREKVAHAMRDSRR